VNIGPNFLTLTRLTLIYISGEPTGPDTKTATVIGNPIRLDKIVAQATKYKFMKMLYNISASCRHTYTQYNKQ